MIYSLRLWRSWWAARNLTNLATIRKLQNKLKRIAAEENNQDEAYYKGKRKSRLWVSDAPSGTTRAERQTCQDLPTDLQKALGSTARATTRAMARKDTAKGRAMARKASPSSEKALASVAPILPENADKSVSNKETCRHLQNTIQQWQRTQRRRELRADTLQEQNDSSLLEMLERTLKTCQQQQKDDFGRSRSGPNNPCLPKTNDRPNNHQARQRPELL